LLDHVAAAPLNHVLRGETWALRRLQPFAGRTVRFLVPPFDFSFTLQESGEVRAAAPGTVPDAAFRLALPVALRVLAHDEAARREVEITGDPELAQAVDFVATHLRWDAEEDLARVFGDVAAHRLAAAGREVIAWQARAAQSVGRNLGRYWTEESGLLARRHDVHAFMDEVDRLRDDAERIEKRIERLERTARGTPPPHASGSGDTAS